MSGNEGLNGTLPLEWATINTLTYIDASDNTGLTGTMPAAWSQVQRVWLEMVHWGICFSSHVGAIFTPSGPPLPLPQLGSLTYLDLSNNTGIQGVLPAEWGVLPHLRYLDVSGNTGPTGTLPSAWWVSPHLH